MFGILEICFLLFLFLFVARIRFSDCDALLHFYEKFAIKPEPRIRGKVVWITGASSGIGEYLAYKLTQCGCKLVLSARRKDELERVKARCLELASRIFPLPFEENYLVLPLDVADFSSHRDCAENVIQHFGQIDFLVNNAGVAQFGSAITTNLDVVQYVMDVNVLGTISLTKAVLPHMVHKKTGQIVVISSASGKNGLPKIGAYGASKHALQGYFHTLGMELNSYNIGVTLVCPGWVYSEIRKNVVRENLQTHSMDPHFPPTTMKTERCADLITIAMVNGLKEVWLCRPPRLFDLYVVQYLPAFMNWWLKLKRKIY
ncbi:dehydrogenase/reductase SDR family member 7-like [Montipora foliosa]|uniref:dehydrogenase/reductase SDR family member 7-like n=1 Tax=Montipora foliosa TaxID=591990 RepID=UPI0035F16A6E